MTRHNAANSHGKFLHCYEGKKQVDSSFPFLIFRYCSAFSAVTSVEYVVVFILGKCLVDS